ncbi:MAG: hypothetical protein ABEI06_09885 [Halobacteriaceae archaeon]
MNRRTRRNQSSLSVWEYGSIIAIILIIIVGGWGGTLAFTTGSADRHPAVDVVSDPNATLGIDTAPDVHINATETLVNVTNDLGQQVTITIKLRKDSTDRGDLVVNGHNEGDQVSISVAQGETIDVQISVPDDSSLVGKTVNFDINGSATGLQVIALNRSVPIKG